MREAVDNEPLLDEDRSSFEDGSCKLIGPVLESLEKEGQPLLSLYVAVQEKEHAEGRSAWAHIKTLRSALTCYIFQLKRHLHPWRNQP